METARSPVAPVDRRPRFDTPNVLWFFGAFAAGGGSTAVVAAVHPAHRGVWIFLVALGFLTVYALLSAVLLRTGWWVPGGVLAATAVGLVPAVGVGFERLVGVWPGAGVSFDPFQRFEGALFALGLATIAAGLVAFALVRFDFLLSTVAAATLFTTQLLLPAFVSRPGVGDHAVTSLVVGALLVAGGLALDRLGRRRAAFWLHVFGLLGVAGGLGYYAARHGHAWAWVVLLVAGAVILLLAAPLRRATWAAYGLAGFYAAIGHYVSSWFGSWRAPLVLAAAGLGLVLLGMALHSGSLTRLLRLDRLPVP